ncbi:mast cell protease 1A-like [Hyperolius riggenbachi]|uniref:mast cell protease 1A-like n=1 Tax=Hyperolius riggenbachi TaxID=752182 RepID=UPI0035A3C850
MEQLHVFLLIFLCSLLCKPSPSVGKFQHKIIGGHEAKPHSRPYMAHLQIGHVFCGGSLIDPGWVLSAAHCHGDITVTLGAHDISQAENSQQIFGVKSYHVHPEYDDESPVPFNDVMLLQLTSKAELNRYVQPIALPTSTRDLPQNIHCSIAGWGLIDKIHTTDKLFETNVTTVSRRLCKRYYPELSDGMICAGSSDKMTDSSQGDSGGPLICGGFQEGIVSFGYHHPPGVYARVGKYLAWIRQVISKHEDPEI